MSKLKLPESLIPLLMHIEPLLARADQYQLGNRVELDWSDDESIHIELDDKREILISFDSDNKDGIRIKDQWIAPFPSIEDAKLSVTRDPNLVYCGMPVKDGVVDIWFYNGRARVEFSAYAGANQSSRAMLLTSLAINYPLKDAITLARAYACNAIRSENGYVSKGWPVAFDDFPIPMCLSKVIATSLKQEVDLDLKEPFKTLEDKSLGFYPIVESAVLVLKLLKLNVKTIMLHLEHTSITRAEEEIKKAIEYTKQYNGNLFISGHWQLAIKYGAYGVHLTQNELAVADLNKIHEKGLRLGLSVHGYYEILRALAVKPSYIAIGHIFPSARLKTAPEALGLNRLALYQQLTGTSSTVAFGGINSENAYRVWRTGICGFSVNQDVLEEGNLDIIVEKMQQIEIQPKL